MTSNGAAILGFFTGRNGVLGYSGKSWKPLGVTVSLKSSAGYGSLVAVVAPSTASRATSCFAGTSTFNGTQSRGLSPSPVPVPAALPLLLGGMAVLGALARCRARAR